MWYHDTLVKEIDILFPEPVCIFCRTQMAFLPIKDDWEMNEALVMREHENAMLASARDVDEIFLLHRPITSSIEVVGMAFHLCPACGWWCIVREAQYDTPKSPYAMYEWAAGSLVSKKICESEIPMSDIRQSLCADYSARFHINPYRFEEMVASIFKSQGLNVEVTSKSRDGGVDVFGWDSAGKVFGVQVKRYREAIGVEQLRAFVGALAIENIPKGIFVTTSRFTSGASAVCDKARMIGINLDLVDANRLFDMLKVVQINEFEVKNISAMADRYTQLVRGLSYGYSYHMNSL